mmetsp:Transcript_138373/g.385977  ORF Transcript_138373/g.385977 Transcript_138373/m.385977 type:complete len:213 (+) Transcript_138373:259-897(+)
MLWPQSPMQASRKPVSLPSILQAASAPHLACFSADLASSSKASAVFCRPSASMFSTSASSLCSIGLDTSGGNRASSMVQRSHWHSNPKSSSSRGRRMCMGWKVDTYPTQSSSPAASGRAARQTSQSPKKVCWALGLQEWLRKEGSNHNPHSSASLAAPCAFSVSRAMAFNLSTCSACSSSACRGAARSGPNGPNSSTALGTGRSLPPAPPPT